MEILKILRPGQWVKNLFVLLPLFFSGGITDWDMFFNSIVAFLAFCFISSSVYCINDIMDMDEDCHHPVKCLRPIASGTISVSQGYLLAVSMFVLATIVMLLLDDRALWPTAFVVTGYYVLSVAYCTILKRYAIIDVCIIASGFVLRVLCGALASDIRPSHWIVMMTFLLTLFLALAKRRDDVLRMNATGEPPRRNTMRYNLTFLNQAITISACVTLVCYIMYTVSPEVTERFDNGYVYITSIFVIIGLLRYLQIVLVDENSGDPTKVIVRDRFTQIVVIGWLLAFLIIIYRF
ncbi:decaprenyl-phosphate phosphoribosyltransferase [Xylanibacter muris]|uniref:Decaprenyl-phosphate phosphoribosyltransferase n=1 Tax=Xylanibacter muris TaxID=2736290 RepID=A0ABX2AJT8_9BACT|nr:decaprenyl-phosphate phosphoribosyltransferase [Xylanibacter muris]NPD91093.1 decaprenyl-phosphate phosphoribosyltransferase [Xylanibacter muris]